MQLLSRFRKQEATQEARAGTVPALEDMNILIIDDTKASLILVETILKKGGFKNIRGLEEARDTLKVFQQFKPEVLLLDWNLGQLQGGEIIAQVREHIPDQTFFPILVLTADQRSEVKHEALTLGVDDFLNKPFAAAEVVLRVRNLLKIRQLDLLHQQQNQSLEALVEERTKQLEQAHLEVLVRLARATEYRDDATGNHVWHVAQISEKLAKELGMSPRQSGLIMRAARLHDVGKVAIPDGILAKPMQLSAAEFEIVKAHTTVGAHILSGGKSQLIQLAETIALSHHERWDGKGYPQGLKGKKIPIAGRIVALADAFDSLIRDRVHQRACTLPEAVEEIISQRGKQFDPDMVDAFLCLYERGEIQPMAAEKVTLMDHSF
jgi:putative two-component system response regulator